MRPLSLIFSPHLSDHAKGDKGICQTRSRDNPELKLFGSKMFFGGADSLKWTVSVTIIRTLFKTVISKELRVVTYD